MTFYNYIESARYEMFRLVNDWTRKGAETKSRISEILDKARGEYVHKESENVKLRELVSILSVINKNMSQCSVTDCNQCPVSNECSESVYLEGLLGIDTKEISWRVQWRNEDSSDIQTENAKLREALEAVLKCAGEIGLDRGCNICPMYNEDGSFSDRSFCRLRPELRNLGFEEM